MLKKRIIPVQLLLGERLVKTVAFGTWRDVGDPVASSKVYNAQNADELVFLNIDRGERTIAPLLRVLERVSAVSFMPLALGGGIRSFADAATLIRHGADKVVLNSAVFSAPEIITQIAEAFGSQAVIVGIDARRDGNGWQVCSDCGRTAQDIPLSDHVRRVVDLGAGEVLIQSIDRDGTMRGYDVPLIETVQRVCPRPVIGVGGAGDFSHLQEAFLTTGVSALGCGSLFNFGDNNPIRAKAFLANHGLKFKLL